MWRVALLALGLPASACTADTQRLEHPAYGPSQIGSSATGMVVTGSALATDVGVEVLQSGGNAVDAAVAAAFALAVVEPSMSGLGGRTQILIRTAAGEFVGIDGATEVPAYTPAATLGEDASGYATVGIPGTVAALAMALRDHGTRSLAEIVAPAVGLAERGFSLPAEEASRIAAVVESLREFAGTRRYFVRRDGSPYRAGERLVQPDLARVLRTIADGGSEAFYRGWIADSIAADMARNDGYVTRADLAGYKAEPALVVRGSYRGYRLVGTFLPASGATTIEALHILENFDLQGRGGTAAWAALVAQALLLSFEDRTREPVETVISKAWAAERARLVADPAGEPVAAGIVTGSGVAVEEGPHTTHLSVADRHGGLVALTQSIGPAMGSRVVTPGLGFLYAATMGYLGRPPPGTRPFSSQSPLIALGDGGRAFVLGGAGARRIISAIVEVVSRVADEGATLPDAMAAPRFHPTAERLILEDRPGTAWSTGERADLGALGFVVEPRSTASYFARIHAIAYDPERGIYVGVADPRWSGVARGPAR